MLEVMWTTEQADRLGGALRELRRSVGLSQEALAYQAGITKNQLQLIEAGRSTGRREAAGPSNPRMATLAGLASVLGVSVAQLMAEAEL
jgi:transcriptional regulator with XRE-family HTH domain